MASAQDAEPARMEPVGANPIGVEPAPAEPVQPDDSVVAPVPQPPYKEGDDITQGMRCYYEGCAVEGKCWGKLLVHMRNTHGLKHKSISGTYFHRMGVEVMPQTTSAL